QVMVLPVPAEKADQLPNTPIRLAVSAEAGTAMVRTEKAQREPNRKLRIMNAPACPADRVWGRNRAISWGSRRFLTEYRSGLAPATAPDSALFPQAIALGVEPPGRRAQHDQQPQSEADAQPLWRFVKPDHGA